MKDELADLAQEVKRVVERLSVVLRENQELRRLHGLEQRRPPVRVIVDTPMPAPRRRPPVRATVKAPTPAPRRRPPIRVNAEAPTPAPRLRSTLASTHHSRAVATESSADKGGGDEPTSPDVSNHSCSSLTEANHSVHNGVGLLLEGTDLWARQSNSSLLGTGVELGAVRHLGTGRICGKELRALSDELLGGRGGGGSGTDGIRPGGQVLISGDLNPRSLSLGGLETGIGCPLLDSSGMEDGPQDGGWVLLPVLPQEDGPGPSPSRGGDGQYKKLSMAVRESTRPSQRLVGARQHRSRPKRDRNRTLRPDLSLSYLKVPDRGKRCPADFSLSYLKVPDRGKKCPADLKDRTRLDRTYRIPAQIAVSACVVCFEFVVLDF